MVLEVIFHMIKIIQSMDAEPMNLPDLIGPVEKAQPEATGSRKAIVWGQDSLLARAVSSFLKSSVWEVFALSNDGTIEALMEEIGRLDPEVVFLCHYRVDEDSVLPLRLIDKYPCLKVITLGLDSNLMQVYSKQKIILQEAADLLSILESGNSTSTWERR